MATKTETNTVFQIVMPEQKVWNKDEGRWEPPIIYNTPQWVKYHETLRILDGRATTEDIQIALDMVDMGATVTPDPRPILQERYAQALKLEAEMNPTKMWELSKYVNETNEWRAAHNLKPLSVEAPNAARPISALVMPGMQMG